MRATIGILFLVSSFFCSAQISVMQEQSQHYAQFGAQSEAAWDSIRAAEGAPAVVQRTQDRGSCALTKRVYGWHPYWVGSVYNNYQWNLLSDLCYFDYTVSPTSGNNLNSSFQWSTSGAVTDAISNGVDVHICATMFSGHSSFWASSAAQQTFISNIISLLQARGGKGVNIDFEGMGASDRIPFTNFMISLSNQLHSAIPNSEVSMALYAVDWSNVFDVPALVPYVDAFIIMGYDYYWSGSTTAGPDDPLYNFQTSYNYTLTKSMTFYLSQGLPESKLLLGLPYYGREWETVSGTVPAATTGNFSVTRTFNVVQANANGYYNTTLWEPNSFSPYYVFQVGGNWRQCFINNGYSLGKRFDAVNQRGIAGIGIWALGYDDGYMDFWDKIEEKFTNCSVVPCTDTIYDMGGPLRNYYNDEDFTYTIAPSGATSLDLDFTFFNTELNYDTLWLYDGASTAAPLIGAYHGANGPGLVSSSGPALTMRFKSDGGVVNAGWYAVWNCFSDVTAPATQISVPSAWVTQNFTASFTDTDNSGGSGIEKSFYNVSDYDGTEWRANAANGFFTDDFVLLNPEWISAAGTWNVGAGVLEQSDESQSNTNIYAALTQNLSNRYLYHWQGKIEGAGNNRRAGIHFFSDDGSLANRGNSYFAWFRVDQQSLEFYKTINDVFYLQSSVPFALQPATWYDFKIFYDRILGTIEVYVNDAFIASWTDASPYAGGDYVSFRSGNCNWQVDDFRVYRSRFPSVNVSIGSPAADIRHQNPNPSTPSGSIASITKDAAGNLSPVVWQDVNVDWTAPAPAAPLEDGSGSDIDTTYNLAQLEANWGASSDQHSGLVQHFYAIGSTPGDSDVVAWTSNGLAANVTHTGLSLAPGQWYYVGVRAENGAGLISQAVVSDGQVAELSTSVQDPAAGISAGAFPNPFADRLFITLSLAREARVSAVLRDGLGRAVAVMNDMQVAPGAHTLPLQVEADLAKGLYLLQVRIDGQEFFANLAHH